MEDPESAVTGLGATVITDNGSKKNGQRKMLFVLFKQKQRNFAGILQGSYGKH
jgi:hypothetical protein